MNIDTILGFIGGVFTGSLITMVVLSLMFISKRSDKE